MPKPSWTAKSITYFRNPFRELGHAGWRQALEAARAQQADSRSDVEEEERILALARQDTDVTFRLVAERARELSIKTALIASTTGHSAVRATELLPELRLISVTHHAGFDGPNVISFTAANRELFEERGGTLLIAPHAFSDVGGRLSRDPADFLGIGNAIANTLRIFGDGMKVACEIVLMAADAGLVRTDEDIISIAGNSRGSNTAIVVSPVNSKDFFSLLVKEILCKPHFENLRGSDIRPPA